MSIYLNRALALVFMATFFSACGEKRPVALQSAERCDLKAGEYQSTNSTEALYVTVTTAAVYYFSYADVTEQMTKSSCTFNMAGGNATLKNVTDTSFDLSGAGGSFKFVKVQ